MTSLRPHSYDRGDAPPEMLLAAEKYESRFSTSFDSLTFFSEGLLAALHNTSGDISDVPSNVVIASLSDHSILDQMRVLSTIANVGEPSTDQRAQYFATLKSIYRKLPTRPDVATQDEQTLFIGIEREGRILAESLGWLPTTHSFHPDAKRIPFEQGLLVGLSRVPDLRNYETAYIIDGAIASGATIISVVEKIRRHTSSVNIFSVHSPYEGLHSLTRYARSERLDLRITVGHATAGINKKFYATDPADPARLVVGDLGDTISGL